MSNIEKYETNLFKHYKVINKLIADLESKTRNKLGGLRTVIGKQFSYISELLDLIDDTIANLNSGTQDDLEKAYKTSTAYFNRLKIYFTMKNKALKESIDEIDIAVIRGSIAKEFINVLKKLNIIIEKLATNTSYLYNGYYVDDNVDEKINKLLSANAKLSTLTRKLG